MEQHLVQHDRDMARGVRGLAPSTGAQLSGKPVLWEPLVHAPLQAAAVTSNVAIALTHQRLTAEHQMIQFSHDSILESRVVYRQSVKWNI